MPPRRPLVTVVAALLASLAACSPGGRDTGLVSELATTTTTAGPAHRWPLTGSASTTPLPDRPAVAVVVDAGGSAPPPAGITDADVVYEETIEQGNSRWLALFQSHDVASIGPVGQLRPVDPKLLAPLGSPLVAYGPSPARFVATLHEAPLVDLGYAAHPAGYTVLGRGPDDLYTSTGGLWAAASGGNPHGLFSYLDVGEQFRPRGSLQVGQFSVMTGPGHLVTWTWDPTPGQWVRTGTGSPSVDDHGEPVSAVNLIVQFVSYKTVTVQGSSSGALPTADVFGDGDAWIFSGGRLLKGRYSKPVSVDVTNFVDFTGVPIRVTPGRTWVMLAPAGAHVTVS